ncbi:hypothetical protein VNO77_20420 [Canavalia gladiata]|uniref:Uncharacterized protein n=1 Tax=Canavalia gladiata TaxID=3824 RepID=A0AAN9QQJ3_CANGL
MSKLALNQVADSEEVRGEVMKTSLLRRLRTRIFWIRLLSAIRGKLIPQTCISDPESEAQGLWFWSEECAHRVKILGRVKCSKVLVNDGQGSIGDVTAGTCGQIRCGKLEISTSGEAILVCNRKRQALVRTWLSNPKLSLNLQSTCPSLIAGFSSGLRNFTTCHLTIAMDETKPNCGSYSDKTILNL